MTKNGLKKGSGISRRTVVGGMAGRMLTRLGFEGRLTLTGDVDAAVDGASFVLIQLRIGGQAARLLDESVPVRFGTIGQETTGAGGLSGRNRGRYRPVAGPSERPPAGASATLTSEANTPTRPHATTSSPSAVPRLVAWAAKPISGGPTRKPR